MHLIPRMATALVFFIYIGEEGLNAQFLTKKYQTPKQLCGSALTNELQLVCEGVYNNMIKKSEGPVCKPALTVHHVLELIYNIPNLPSRKKAKVGQEVETFLRRRLEQRRV